MHGMQTGCLHSTRRDTRYSALGPVEWVLDCGPATSFRLGGWRDEGHAGASQAGLRGYGRRGEEDRARGMYMGECM